MGRGSGSRNVTSKEAAKFIEDITQCFGVPNRIVIDLGSTFTRADFWDFYQDNLIDVYYSSVAHPVVTARSSVLTTRSSMVSRTESSTMLPHTQLDG
jgi:hypothetical protein